VSAIAALLESHGARVWRAHGNAPPRVPRGARVAILESPLPAELRALAAGGVPVIVLAERAEPADALAAAQLGARALLAKNCTLAELTIAIRSALGAAGTPGRPSLTSRQREVLQLIVEGLDNTQIAARLGISERTVRAHVSQVLERTGAANRTQAAVAAIQRGWLAVIAVVSVLGLFVSQNAVAAVNTPAQLRGALAAQMRAAGGASGAWVYDGGAQQTIFKWNAARSRVPASVEKLVTTSAALERLGADARFETEVLATGEVAEGTLDGDLYLRGSGDPTFGTNALSKLAGLVSDTGLEQVTGRVRGDESFFDRLRGGPSSRFGISPWVGPLSALSFNRGGMRPFGRGWQTAPAAFVAERMRVSLRRDDVTVGGHGRAGTAPTDARTIAACPRSCGTRCRSRTTTTRRCCSRASARVRGRRARPPPGRRWRAPMRATPGSRRRSQTAPGCRAPIASRRATSGAFCWTRATGRGSIPSIARCHSRERRAHFTSACAARAPPVAAAQRRAR
jgi:DNA-binding CsgD family transcriptional regulator